MDYRVAKKIDIEGVLELHRKYHVETISEQDKEDGFVTTQLSATLLEELIDRESGLFIAKDNNKVISYVMAASWDYCSRWPMFQVMIKDLKNIEFMGMSLDTKNSYQYGPVCVDAAYRGKGVIERIFDLAREFMGKKYSVLVTFINKKNPRSLGAHVDKLKLEIANEFEYNNNSYLTLVYDTSKKVIISKQIYNDDIK